MEPTQVRVVSAKPQKPFPFLQLPAEMRTRIYELVIGNNLVHIYHSRKSIYGPYICTNVFSDFEYYSNHKNPKKEIHEKKSPSNASDLDHFDLRDSINDTEEADDTLSWESHGDCDTSSKDPFGRRLLFFLGILLVCKQVYQEASAVVFELNTFAASNSADLQFFLQTLVPWQTETIRTLRLYIYDEYTWKGNNCFVQKLTGLRELQVFIDTSVPDDDEDSWEFVEYSMIACDRLFASDGIGSCVKELAAFRACANLTHVEVMITIQGVEEDYKKSDFDIEMATSIQLRAWERQVRRMILDTAGSDEGGNGESKGEEGEGD